MKSYRFAIGANNPTKHASYIDAVDALMDELQYDAGDCLLGDRGNYKKALRICDRCKHSYYETGKGDELDFYIDDTIYFLIDLEAVENAS